MLAPCLNVPLHAVLLGGRGTGGVNPFHDVLQLGIHFVEGPAEPSEFWRTYLARGGLPPPALPLWRDRT